MPEKIKNSAHSEEVIAMEVIVKGEPKEIAAFVAEIQRRQRDTASTVYLTNSSRNDLIKENGHSVKMKRFICGCKNGNVLQK